MHQNRKHAVYSLGGLVTLAVLLVGWTLFQPTELIHFVHSILVHFMLLVAMNLRSKSWP